MSVRLDLLPANQLPALIKEMHAELDNLKTAQKLGTGSVRFYQSQSPNQYDWTGTLPADPGGSVGDGLKKFLVTATAQVQPALFADLIYELWVNKGSGLQPYTIVDYSNDIEAGAGTKPWATFVYLMPLTLSQKHMQRWFISLTGDTTSTAAFKFYVVANDEINITVEQLN